VEMKTPFAIMTVVSCYAAMLDTTESLCC